MRTSSFRRIGLVSSLLLGFACGDGGMVPSGTGPGDPGEPNDAAEAALDASVPRDAEVVVEDAAGSADAGAGPVEESWPKACSDVYADDALPHFELSFTPEELAGLEADCQSQVQRYRPVLFTYQGESRQAMARLKGNWSWDCNKMQFVISFNEVDKDGRFHGLRKLVLDAPWYDRTFLHERAAFRLFRALELPSSCVNNARLSVNGEYYGVYANVERLDKEYLQRNFEQADGNLYQGGSELKTNEEIGDVSDLEALRAATTIEQITALVDMEEAIAEWAAEAMLPAMDNYWAGVEINYYLYAHPSRGFVYLPYDMDITFGDGAYPDGSLVAPGAAQADPIRYEHVQWRKEDLVKTVLADTTWCERFVAAVVEARAQYEPEAMAAQVDLWAAQIASAVAEDPRRPFSAQAHADAVASLKAFFAERALAVDAWLTAGGQCPAVW